MHLLSADTEGARIGAAARAIWTVNIWNFFRSVCRFYCLRGPQQFSNPPSGTGLEKARLLVIGGQELTSGHEQIADHHGGYMYRLQSFVVALLFFSAVG